LAGLDDATPDFSHPDLSIIAARLTAAQKIWHCAILLMGAHLTAPA